MPISSTIILGIATSFIASIIFTYLFTQLKPDIHISAVIGHSNGTYKIKVMNKSKFAATNIKAELAYINFFNVPGGQETNATPIRLVRADVFALDKFDENSQFATYTYRFVTKRRENLQHGITQNNRQHIRFKITATHSLSNISKVFKQEFTAAQIVHGDFALRTLEIALQ